MHSKLFLIVFLFIPFVSPMMLASEEPCAKDSCQLNIPKPCPCEDPGPFFNQGQGLCPDRLDSGYNAPAAYDVCGSWDLFAKASFILWEPREEGLPTIRKEKYRDDYSNHVAAKIIDTKWKYHPGFIVSLGMNFFHDGWTLLGEYTRLNGTNKISGKISSYSSILPYWIDMDATTSRKIAVTQHHWKFWLDLGDLSLARPFYCGTYLILKPSLGLRGGRIDQDFFASYENRDGTFDRCKNKSDSWLVGPRIGLDSSWFCCEQFRVLGNIGASLCYQHFNTSLKEDHLVVSGGSKTSTVKGTNQMDPATINPHMNLEIGLGWGRYIDRTNWHIDVVAKYNFQVFWNQNMMRSLNESSYIGLPLPPATVPFHLSDPVPGDLSIHGFTLSLQLDF